MSTAVAVAVGGAVGVAPSFATVAGVSVRKKGTKGMHFLGGREGGTSSRGRLEVVPSGRMGPPGRVPGGGRKGKGLLLQRSQDSGSGRKKERRDERRKGGRSSFGPRR